MKINKEAMQLILDSLEIKRINNNCVLCKNEKYIISDELFLIPSANKNGTFDVGCPTIVGRCKNCGHTIFIDPFNLNRKIIEKLKLFEN